jgi:hypothetical protein
MIKLPLVIAILVAAMLLTMFAHVLYITFIDHTSITQEVTLKSIEHESYDVVTTVWFTVKGDTSIYKMYVDVVKCDEIRDIKESQMARAIEDEKKLKVIMSNFKYCEY